MPRTSNRQEYNIQAAATLLKTTPSLLRIWELRYNWPRPQRRDNGYRYFTEFQVSELRRALDLVRDGHSISKLIVDGMPAWPSTHKVLTSADVSDVSLIPVPTTNVGKSFRRQVEEALRWRRHDLVRKLLHESLRFIHPLDRPLAVLLPILCGVGILRRQNKPIENDEAFIEFIERNHHDTFGHLLTMCSAFTRDEATNAKEA